MPTHLRRQTFMAKKGEVDRNWRIVDATNQPLGRLAAEVAIVLMGKHRPEYTPHVDTGDFVIITNASNVALTGRKAEQRLKMRYSRYPGGLKAQTYGEVREHKPEKLIEDAVRRMLPKNRLGRVMLSKLKVYAGTEHPHTSQTPTPLEI
ncbi:MAG: 50S ribosomal protein L13 [Phycisphaeraceae bacterium]|nr:50S ribosomal protein L13 [Phycisphaeraceae bacterium]MCW5761659.1 50S ribosomal protein L13 [Phycisphaeraceae bacterium]